MNAICTILTYRYFGGWVFDDAATGLNKEAFVAGADSLVEFYSKGANGVRLNFSASAFPGAICLAWVRAEYSGNVYRLVPDGPEAWFCPALLKYFDAPPKQIWFTATPVHTDALATIA